MLKYRGFLGQVEFDDQAELFYGEVINARDVITFQGTTAKSLKKAFIDSVNDYLALCNERNEEPERPFSGKFNVRIEPELHKEAFVSAKQAGLSLNAWVTEAIKRVAIGYDR